LADFFGQFLFLLVTGHESFVRSQEPCGLPNVLSGSMPLTHPSDLFVAAFCRVSIVEAVPIVEADWPNRN